MALVTSGITLKNLICTKLEAQGREVLRPNHVRGGGIEVFPNSVETWCGWAVPIQTQGLPNGAFLTGNAECDHFV